MPVKTVKNDRNPVQCMAWSGGRIIDNRSTDAPHTVTADAIWHRPLPSGPLLPPTYMEIVEIRFNPERYDETYVNPSNGLKYGREGLLAYVYNNKPITPFEVTSDDGTLSLNRALSKITNSRGTFGETLVEGRQTAQLLYKRGKQLVDSVRALRRRDIRALERALGVPLGKGAADRLRKMPHSQLISDGYLEFQFGIMPIVQNIRDIASIYSEGLRQRGDRINRRSGSNGLRDWNTPLGPARGASAIYGRVDNPLVANLNEIGLFNIPLEVWNTVPFSFVFDWGANVGSYLGAITGASGMTLYGTRTEVRQAQRFSTGNGALYSYRKDISRWPLFYPRASLPPQLTREASMSFGKVVTLFALGRQLIGGKW